MPIRPDEALRIPQPLLQAITQWTPGVKPTWTIAEVRAALRLHALGDFSRSALLVDTMGEDDCIPGLLEKLVDAVLGCEFRLDPVDKPNRQLSKQIASQLGPLWWDMFPEGELDEFMRWYRMLGAAVAVLDWVRTANSWKARLRVLHPQYLRWDDTRKVWIYQAREGEFEVNPGDGTWLLISDGQRGWMRGLVRPCAVPWVTKHLTIRDWSRYNEKHGLPIIKAYAPAIADEGDRDEFWEDLQGLYSETVAQLPTHLDDNGAKFDLDLLEAKDQSWQTFPQQIDRSDRRFTILFLGGNQSTEVNAGTGTNASAKQHANELDDKATALAKRVSTALRVQGLWPVVAVTYAAAVFEVTPWPVWDTEPPEDTKAEAQDQEAFGKAIKAVQDAGYDVANVDELADKHKLKLVKREAPTPPQPAPGAPVDPSNEGAKPATAQGSAKARARNLLVGMLASGFVGAKADGFIAGQAYADALTEESTADAATLLEDTLAAILKELDAVDAESPTAFEDLKTRLRAMYADLDPSALTELTYRVMVMGEFAGRHAVNEDA